MYRSVGYLHGCVVVVVVGLAGVEVVQIDGRSFAVVVVMDVVVACRSTLFIH